MKNMLRMIKEEPISVALIIVIICLVLVMSRFSVAGEVNIQMQFAYNGVTTAEGFNFYQEDPAGVETKITQITDPSVRSWDGIIQVESGRSLYYLTAYGDGWETDRSNVYPFEYIEPATPGNPPPTIIIRFN